MRRVGNLAARLWYRRRLFAGIGFIGFLGLNVAAFLHARAMTHFSASGVKTNSPDKLSLVEKLTVLAFGVQVPKPVNQITPTAFGLAYETHRFAASDGTGLEAWFVPQPKSPGTVVLFHGFTSSKASLLRPAAAFHQLGYACVLVDFRGCGGSAGFETTVGMSEGDDVAKAMAFAQRLTPGQPIILFGVSMGAAAILRAVAHEGAAPAAVILECPFDRLLTTVGHRFQSMGLPTFPGAPLLVFWGGVQCGFNGFAHNPAEYARAVRCPALLLQGRADAWVKAEEAQAIFDQLGGKKELVFVDGAGHESLLALRPEQWKEAVGRFLRGI